MTDGLWQVCDEVPVADDGGRLVNDAQVFRLDGDTVTLRLHTLNPAQWKSADDFYRVAAEWRGDTLWYRPPFGDWAELATFEDGRFVDVGNGRKRIFCRIGEDEVADFNRAVLAPREPHDYAIRADGGV